MTVTLPFKFKAAVISGHAGYYVTDRASGNMIGDCHRTRRCAGSWSAWTYLGTSKRGWDYSREGCGWALYREYLDSKPLIDVARHDVKVGMHAIMARWHDGVEILYRVTSVDHRVTHSIIQGAHWTNTSATAEIVVVDGATATVLQERDK